MIVGAMLSALPLPEARAQAPAARAGRGVDALPGVHEVPLGVRDAKGLNARAGFGYGWTESVLDMDDSHHRLQLDAAASATPLRWLSAGLRVLGRYDAHAGASSDSGAIGETHLAARTSWPLSPDLHAGGALSLWFPGGDTVGRGLSALSGDVQGLLAYAPRRWPFTVGLSLGLRIDRSKHAGEGAERYSAADRLALGASDDVLALHTGVAVAYRAGRIEWVGEWAWRMYFEYAGDSPMWIRGGARYWPLPPLQLELLLGLSPSGRPSLAEGAPLAVVEPRLWAGLSATYAWSWERPQPRAAAAPPVAPVVRAPQPGTVRGQVSAPNRTGIAGAALVLRQGETELGVGSDGQGAFSFGSLEPGSYTLDVAADGFVPEQRTFELLEGAALQLDITLKRALPQGQIRGTVRRFNGTPVVATIAIEALRVTQPSKDDGTFEIEVPPGEYAVAVSAPGFRSQTRTAKVEQNGVAILVVELEVEK